MTKVTKEQITEIFLQPLTSIFYFNQKPDFSVEMYLDAIDRMGFKDDKELRRVHNEIVSTCDRMPKPVKIEEILKQNRKEKEEEIKKKINQPAIYSMTDTPQWQKVKSILYEKHSDPIFASYNQDLKFLGVKTKTGTVCMCLPNDKIQREVKPLAHSILKAWKDINPSIKDMRWGAIFNNIPSDYFYEMVYL